MDVCATDVFVSTNAAKEINSEQRFVSLVEYYNRIKYYVLNISYICVCFKCFVNF